MKDVLRWMLDELKASRLEVAKLPSRGGYRRVVVQQNAPWYQEFCAAHLHDRGTRGGRHGRNRPRTYIKRRETIAALERMLSGRPAGVYQTRLLELAESLPARA